MLHKYVIVLAFGRQTCQKNPLLERWSYDTSRPNRTGCSGYLRYVALLWARRRASPCVRRRRDCRVRSRCSADRLARWFVVGAGLASYQLALEPPVALGERGAGRVRGAIYGLRAAQKQAQPKRIPTKPSRRKRENNINPPAARRSDRAKPSDHRQPGRAIFLNYSLLFYVTLRYLAGNFCTINLNDRLNLEYSLLFIV